MTPEVYFEDEIGQGYWRVTERQAKELSGGRLPELGKEIEVELKGHRYALTHTQVDGQTVLAIRWMYPKDHNPKDHKLPTSRDRSLDYGVSAITTPESVCRLVDQILEEIAGDTPKASWIGTKTMDVNNETATVIDQIEGDGFVKLIVKYDDDTLGMAEIILSTREEAMPTEESKLWAWLDSDAGNWVAFAPSQHS